MNELVIYFKTVIYLKQHYIYISRCIRKQSIVDYIVTWKDIIIDPEIYFICQIVNRFMILKNQEF